MKIQQLLLALAALAVLALVPTSAKADSLTFTISNPLRSGAPGSLLTFNGMLQNGPGAITNIVLSDSLAAGLTLTQVFAPSSLGSNASFTGALFEIMIDNAAAPGIYSGSLAFAYTTSMGGQDLSAAQDIRVTVGGTDPIPEPATMVLLGTGLAGALAAKRRRRRTTDTP